MEELIRELVALAPLLARTTDSRAVQLAAQLAVIGNDEISRRMAETNQTREQVLQDAAETWEKARAGADDLLGLGHGPE